MTPTTKHQHIVDGLLKKYRQCPDVVAVMLFGSMAKGSVGPNSDIDMEVISTSIGKWQLFKKQMDGIFVDFVFVPKAQFLDQVRGYPYLCYDLLAEKILYDPKNLVIEAQVRIGKYFASNPEVAQYWEDDLAKMRQKKKAGTHRMADIVAAYDTAERRFSNNGKISRDFLLGAS